MPSTPTRNVPTPTIDVGLCSTHTSTFGTSAFTQGLTIGTAGVSGQPA